MGSKDDAIQVTLEFKKVIDFYQAMSRNKVWLDDPTLDDFDGQDDKTDRESDANRSRVQ